MSASAWDCAGAVVFTPSAIVAWWGIGERISRSAAFPPDAPLIIDPTTAIFLSICGVYCIFRICGVRQ